jgi:hypothetical protein
MLSLFRKETDKMKKKHQPDKVRVQLLLDTQIYKTLRKRAVDNLQTLSRFITSLVESWEQKKK